MILSHNYILFKYCNIENKFVFKVFIIKNEFDTLIKISYDKIRNT